MGSSRKITSILLNYNRPENMDRVIERIRMQTVESNIFIWDNSGEMKLTGNADVIIKSTRNFYCHPRYVLTAFVDTPFVWTQDDDRLIKDAKLFERLIDAATEYPEDCHCYYGRNFHRIPSEFDDRLYTVDNHEVKDEDLGWVFDKARRVQMGATGLCFARTEVFGRLPSTPLVKELTEKDMKYGDDMWASAYTQMRVAPCIGRGVEKIDDKGEGLCHQADHYTVRDKLSREYWR